MEEHQSAADNVGDAVKMLLVEDEANRVEIVKSYLEAESYHVTVAYDGLSGLEAARREKPDLVALDVVPPGIEGIEASRRLRPFSDAYVPTHT